MKKLIARLLWVPVGLVLVVFLVANRHSVPINFDPFGAPDPETALLSAPLWFWMMSMLLLGFFLGATTQWVSG